MDRQAVLRESNVSAMGEEIFIGLMNARLLEGRVRVTDHTFPTRARRAIFVLAVGVSPRLARIFKD